MLQKQLQENKYLGSHQSTRCRSCVSPQNLGFPFLSECINLLPPNIHLKSMVWIYLTTEQPLLSGCLGLQLPSLSASMKMELSELMGVIIQNIWMAPGSQVLLESLFQDSHNSGLLFKNHALALHQGIGGTLEP